MKTADFKNGFYWVVVTEDGNDPEVAEFIHGEWYVAGSNRAIQFDDKKVKVLSTRLPQPALLRVNKLVQVSVLVEHFKTRFINAFIG